MSQSAFAFWRDRDEEAEDKPQKHSNTQFPEFKRPLSSPRKGERTSPVYPRPSAAPPSRPLVSPSGKAQLRNDRPLRPRVSPTVSPSQKPRSPVRAGQTAVTTKPPATRAKGTSLHVHIHLLYS